jgi:site-specific DNA-methyltransferase (adenine-specific)
MGVQIFTGDCREILRTLEPASFDLVLTDPPYGETSLEWDRWVKGWPALVLPLIKPSGSMWVFGSIRMFLDNLDDFRGWRFVQDLVWEKHNGSGFLADRFKRVHEHVLHFVRDGAAWGEIYKDVQYTHDAVARTVKRKKGRPAHMGHIEQAPYASIDGGPRLMRSVLQVRSEHGSAFHPTQKPVGIVEPPLLFSCPPDGRVLDPFAGAGTTGVVADRNGRDAVLIEANPIFATIARERVAAGLAGRVTEARIRHGHRPVDYGSLFSAAQHPTLAEHTQEPTR